MVSRSILPFSWSNSPVACKYAFLFTSSIIDEYGEAHNGAIELEYGVLRIAS